MEIFIHIVYTIILVRKIILVMIRFYQNTVFFHGYFFRLFYLTDAVCRFTPSCSNYTYQAVEKYGVIKGLFLGLKRVLRCHPAASAGADPLV